MALVFRKLRADEIECRIAMIKETGLSLLLYKDARVDQNILDETVGPMNWQRTHSRDNANCTVSLWDSEKQQWIAKEDTGTESYTEKEKGLASDSFKRACFNWGIGRELYTAPFIWISDKSCDISQAGGKLCCYDKFFVAEIGYDSEGRIEHLVVVNRKSGAAVFTFGTSKTKTAKKSENTKAQAGEKEKAEPEHKEPGRALATDQSFEGGIDEIKAKALIQKCEDDKVDAVKILEGYKVENIRQITLNMFMSMMKPANWEKIKERYGSNRKDK